MQRIEFTTPPSPVKRADVTPSIMERWMGTATQPSESQHNKLVESFMAEAEASNPVRFAEVCESYPVISESALEAARKREIPAFSPSDEAFGDELASLTTAEFISAMATAEAALLRASGR
jgi:hypothetical protein